MRALRLRAARYLPTVLLADLKQRAQLAVETGDVLSDGLFLAALGCSGRNYRRDCAICLTDNIMGTTCGCGHTGPQCIMVY